MRALCLWLLADAGHASSLLIRDVTPIDPLAGALPVQDVLLQDGKIAALGALQERHPNVPVLDGRGKFLIPGLWDMHVHFTYEPRLTEHMAALFISYGITSVRDTGGTLDRLLPVREQLASRDDAPSLYLSGPLLDGGSVVYDGGAVPELGVPNRDQQQAAARVQALAHAGVDFVKIYEMVTPEVFNALVKAAKQHRLPIAAHVPLSLLASDVAPRVDSLEHFRNLALDCAENAEDLLAERRALLSIEDSGTAYAKRAAIHAAQAQALHQENAERCDALIKALKNTIQVPTIRLTAMTQRPPFEDAGWDAALARLPDDVGAEWEKAPQYMDRETYRASGEWALNMLKRLYDASVPIGAGTDTPIGWSVPGFSLHRELEMFSLAGMSNLDALASATVVPPSFFGLEETHGRIAPGYVADLVLLDQDPMIDITNTQRIHSVIRAAKIVSSRADPANSQ